MAARPRPRQLGLLAAVRPDSPAPGAALLGILVLAAVHGDDLDARDSLATVCVHAVHVAAGLAAAVPVRASLERAALSPVLRRFLGIQAASEAVLWTAVVVGALPTTGTGAGLLAALAGARLLVLACGLAVARRRTERRRR